MYKIDLLLGGGGEDAWLAQSEELIPLDLRVVSWESQVRCRDYFLKNYLLGTSRVSSGLLF